MIPKLTRSDWKIEAERVALEAKRGAFVDMLSYEYPRWVFAIAFPCFACICLIYTGIYCRLLKKKIRDVFRQCDFNLKRTRQLLDAKEAEFSSWLRAYARRSGEGRIPRHVADQGLVELLRCHKDEKGSSSITVMDSDDEPMNGVGGENSNLHPSGSTIAAVPGE